MSHYFCVFLCFILMPQWNCDNLHCVWGATVSHSCSLLSNHFHSDPQFDLLLPAVLGIAEFHRNVCVATVWNLSSLVHGCSVQKAQLWAFQSMAGCGHVDALRIVSGWRLCVGDLSDFWSLGEWRLGATFSNCSHKGAPWLAWLK